MLSGQSTKTNKAESDAK